MRLDHRGERGGGQAGKRGIQALLKRIELRERAFDPYVLMIGNQTKP